MNHFTYSPLEVSEYVVPTTPRCEARAIMDLPPTVREAAWNLLWLSNPGMDGLPMLGVNWWKEYTPVVKIEGGQVRSLIMAVVDDAFLDIVLQRKLLMHPRVFHDWWRTEDITIYDTSKIIGAPWREMVAKRALAAAERVEADTEGISFEHGNVVYPKAWKRA